MKSKHSFSVASLACLLMTAAANPAAAQTPEFRLPRDAGAVVVEYTMIHHMIAEPDPVPLLRIYADGRVRVHVPVYMARAGDYEGRMSQQELRDLLADFAADGLLEFDAEAVRAERREAQAADRQAGRLYHVSDVSETVIDIELRAYKPARAHAPTANFSRRIRWPNVYTDARQFLNVAGVQSLARAEERLRVIMQRPGLAPVKRGQSQ